MLIGSHNPMACFFVFFCPVPMHALPQAVVQSAEPVLGSPNFRDPSATGLNPNLTYALTALAGGGITPGTRLAVDYDFQPGPMGFHSYDVWDGIVGHLPWPPGSSTVASTAPRQPPSITARRKNNHRRQQQHWHRHSTVTAPSQHRLGSPHNDFLWSSGATSSAFTDPLYYELAVNSTLALLDMFAARGTPINFIVRTSIRRWWWWCLVCVWCVVCGVWCGVCGVCGVWWWVWVVVGVG